MAFRIRSKNLFLTYPQVNGASTNKETLLEHLVALHPGAGVRVCVEQHADGGTHYHAVVCCPRPVNIRNARHWDYNDHHANVQPIKSKAAARKYLEKGGDYIDGGEISLLSNNGRSNGSNEGSPNKRYRDALEAENELEFLERIKRGCTRDWVLQESTIRSFAQRHYSTGGSYQSRYCLTDFRPCESILSYIQLNLTRPRDARGRPKSLALVGPSRTGKTELARCIGPHIYLNSYYALSEMITHEWADYIIFDDIPWERIPAPKALLGCQSDFVLTDKYHKKISIKNWSKPAIVLWNEDMDPRSTWSEDTTNWAKKNIIFINIFTPLY